MSIIKMILLIGLLIFVHELGHFLVARMFKIKVSRFCFGLPFGPILYEKKIGEVTYGIHWLFFLGGYVSFPDDEKDNGLPADSPDLFKNRPAYQKACVDIAGVSANLITAYLIVLFCCFHWHYLPSGTYDVYVDNFSENVKQETLASGLKEGDKIISINGREVVYPHELRLVANASKKFDNRITPSQYNKVLVEFLQLNPSLNSDSILNKNLIVNIPKVTEEEPVILTKSDIYGLKTKQKFIPLSEDLQKIRNDAYGQKTYKVKSEISVKDFVVAIADTYSPINITVQRNNEKINLKSVYSGEDGVIGVVTSYKEKPIITKTVKESIKATNYYIGYNMKMMLWSLKMIVTGRVHMSNVQGVVAITKIGSDIIEQQGMISGLLLTAIISLNLVILNLLPIPALDGGHLMFLIIEKIKGSPVDEKIIEKVSMFFFYILIALMLLVIAHDIWAIWIEKLY